MEWRLMDITNLVLIVQQLKSIIMSNKPEREPDGSTFDYQNYSSGHPSKMRKRDNTLQKRGKKSQKVTKKDGKKEKAAKKSEEDLCQYEGQKNHFIMSLLHSQHANQMPTHHQLQFWRKQLLLLSKPHLPDYFRLFNFQSQSTSLPVLTVQRIFPLLNKKAHKNQFLYERNRGGQASVIKSIQEEKPPYLIALEQLGFYKLSKDNFVTLFLGLNDLTEEELLRIYDFLKLMDGYVYWPIAIFEPFNFQLKDMIELLQNFQMKDEKAKFFHEIFKIMENSQAREISENNPISDPGSLYYKTSSDPKNQSVERPSEQIEERIYSDDIDSQKQIKKDEDLGILDESQAKHKKQSLPFPKREIIGQMEEEFYYQPYEEAEGEKEEREEKIEKKEEEEIVKQLEQQVFIWLIGTIKYLKVESQIIPWKKMSNAFRRELFSKTKFGFFLPQINQMIESLNKFNSQVEVQLKVDESKMFLARLCQYHEENEKYPCIPFRYEIVKAEKIEKSFDRGDKMQGQKSVQRSQKLQKNEKKVLIRCFYHDRSQLKWVPFQKVKANYILPRLNENNLIYLYLTKKLSFNEILTNFLYNEYFFLQAPSKNNIFNKLYPQFHSSQSEAAKMRCIVCNFMIYEMKFVCCSICREYCHMECAEEKERVFFGLFGEKSIENNLWICERCEPCSVCYEAVNDQLLKCNQCKQYFHTLCGRIKGISYDDQHMKNTENFFCQSCLKCKMCTKKLKDKDYYYDSTDNEFFCNDCYIQIAKNNICHVCMSSKDGKWILCQYCKKWTHDICDKEALKNQSEQSLLYWCPNCRRKEMRKVFGEIIHSITAFDELQFFTEPSYEKLPLYKTIIDTPMCLLKMKEKAMEGLYDQDARDKIIRDLNLIVENALQYNMPKDDAYFQAKILNILGNKALKYLTECFTPTISEIVTGEVYEKIKKLRKQLHHEINEKYPEMLVNYESQKSYIEVRKKPLPLNSGETMIFSSPAILRNFFKNSSIYFHLKKQKIKIQNLFTMPKNEKGIWKQIKGDVCYYHNCSDIISFCDICCESYCCVTECFKHRECSCGVKGCRCDKFDCSCPPQKQKERKTLEKKLVDKYREKGKTPLQTIMQLTQNYKYCFKCCLQTLQNRECYICKTLCSWGYSRCKNCNKCWHNKCEKVIKIPNLCSQCCKNTQNMNTLEQFLFLECKMKLLKVTKIQKYLPLITEIYFREGLRLTIEQMEELVLENYDQFLIREKYFREYELNFKKKEKQYENSVGRQTKNRLLRKYFAKYSLKPEQIQQYEISQLDYLEKSKQLLEKYLKKEPSLMEEEILQKINEDYWNQMKNKNKNSQPEQIKSKLERVTHQQIQIRRDSEEVMEMMRKRSILKRKEVVAQVFSFLMSIYEKSKFTLRKGSTCRLKAQKDYWRILKKWGKSNNQYEIKLYKKHQSWILEINNSKHYVQTITDIIENLRKITRLQTFKELGEFLGFTIYEPFYQANHFTYFLQSHLLDEMSLLQRMSSVTKLYESFTWGKNGVFTTELPDESGKHVTYEYNITKNDIFYLNKKKKGKKKEESKQVSKAPYISFEDLKKHLEETPVVVNKTQTSISMKNPIITNQVFIAPSKIHKLGLFSRKSLKRNTIVIQYIGEIVSQSVADLREEQFHFGCYMFSIGKTSDKKDIIDATFRGNMARYLNHSCDPNCKAKTEYINSSPRIIIYTIRDIQKYEELTYDYQFNVDAEDKLECTCGAKNCQGRLN